MDSTDIFGINELNPAVLGLPSIKTHDPAWVNTKWEMSQQVSDYFANQYKDQSLANINNYTGVLGNPHVEVMRGSPLLDPRQFLPYFHEGEAVDKYWEDDYWSNSGYTYPGEEEIYLKDLNYAGHQVNPVEPNILPEDPKAGVRSTAIARLQNMELIKKAQEETQRLQDYADWESSQTARTGIHESIHSNLLDKKIGAYPNAIAEMLRGTVVLGTPGNTTKYLGERIYGPPDINNQYIESRYSPNYEQSELLTQALTELLYPRPNHPDLPENATMGSSIYADYDYSHWNMDRPGGRMTKKGLDEFLFKRSQPFYEQILSDAKAGYVQPSIWSTKD